MKNGFILPYNQFIAYKEEHPEFDLSSVIVYADRDYFDDFCYKTEHLSHDALIDVILTKHAFYGRKGLNEVVIPDSVSRINYCAFERCSNLNSITLTRKIKKIEHGAIYGPIIRCYEKSTAHKYAMENNIKFELI